eukprot:m.59858 g.59858  ORF g.59858 m.59858 type:complete len:376 (-) comp7925_c0_seq5:1556-2683(-)
MGDTELPWLHMDCASKRASEERLIKAKEVLHGKDGLFFVRPRRTTEDNNEYVMVILYKGKPTHHLLTKKSIYWLVNDKQYGEFETLEELVFGLSKPQKGFPVVLYDFVPNLFMSEIQDEIFEAPLSSQVDEHTTTSNPSIQQQQPDQSQTQQHHQQQQQIQQQQIQQQQHQQQQQIQQIQQIQQQQQQENKQPRSQATQQAPAQQSTSHLSRGSIDEMPANVFQSFDPYPEWYIPHQNFPGDTFELLDMIERTPKISVIINRKDTEIHIGCNLNPRRLPDQPMHDEFEFVFVTSLDERSLAYSCGMRLGDIIYRVNNTTCNHSFKDIAKEIASSTKIVFLLARPSMILEEREQPDEENSRIVGVNDEEGDYFSDE